jgi:hypothetical protein
MENNKKGDVTSYHEFTGKKEVQYVRCFLGGYRRPKEWRRLQDGRKTIGIKEMSVYLGDTEENEYTRDTSMIQTLQRRRTEYTQAF